MNNKKELNFKTIDINSLTDYLISNKIISKDDKINKISSPGEGNMNLVLRLHISNSTTLIVKKSFSYINKYPQIEAPIERIFNEALFYSKIKTSPYLLNKSAKILLLDKANTLIIFEDLGHITDYSFLYENDKLVDELQLNNIISYLTTLHSCNFEFDEKLENIEMKKLNHLHIFDYPFQINNGFDLDTITPGLNDAAKPFKSDTKLKEKINKLGERYLRNGITLLHGDFYPASWINSSNNLKVIDTEFTFFGDKEFDFGVMLAHLKLTNHSEDLIKTALNQYKNHLPLNEKLLKKYMGVEIFRRLIGLAQLPLTISLNDKKTLMNYAYKLLMNS